MSEPIIPNRLLSIRDASDLLDVHVKTIRRRIKAGELQVIRTGRIIRIHPNELKKLIACGVSL